MFNQKYYYGQSMIKKNLEQYFLILNSKFRNQIEGLKYKKQEPMQEKNVIELHHLETMQKLISEIQFGGQPTGNEHDEKYSVFKKLWTQQKTASLTSSRSKSEMRTGKKLELVSSKRDIKNSPCKLKPTRDINDELLMKSNRQLMKLTNLTVPNYSLNNKNSNSKDSIPTTNLGNHLSDANKI